MTRKQRHVERRRGRHKKHRSAEVVAWDERVRCEKKPSWMDAATYEKLAALRREIDPLQ